MSNKFEYNYSAPTEDERREIESIKEAYSPNVTKKSGVERLRELDKKVKNPPLICVLTVGIIGLLIFGLGICCAIEWEKIAVGVILSVAGLAIMGVNPYIYRVFLARRKKKYSAQILALSDELLDGKK